MNDTERLNWLEKNAGYALVSDDNGHWACVVDGMQNCPMDDGTCDISTTFFIEKRDWYNTPREAIDSAMKRDVDDIS